MTSPFLTLDGAVEADAPDTGVPAHYGNPFAEQKALLAGEGIVDLSHRGVVRIGGPDRLNLLHALSSQHLESLPAGQWTEALILSPTGHVEHAIRGFDDGESFWGHVEPGAAPALVAWLDSMRFMSRVEVSDASAERAVVAWSGTRTEIVDRGSLAALAVVARPCGSWAYEALRIERGEPRLGVDTDPRTIPNEVGWIGTAVHMDKGCYRGQETVARVHNLGRPPRRLVRLLLDGSVDRLPAIGAAVTLDGVQVGFVGSSARHHELGPIGLALVKRGTAVEATLLADGIAAAQDVIVDPEVGLHVRARL